MSTAAGGVGPEESGGEPRSLGQIVGDITADMSRLIRQELDLGKAEMKQEVSKFGKGVGMFGGAGLTGFFTLFLMSLALAYLLDDWMPVELAALIVAVLWGIVAAVLACGAARRCRPPSRRCRSLNRPSLD